MQSSYPLITDVLGFWLPFAKKVLKQIASKTIIFNNLPTAEALKHLILYNALVFQCQNANTEASHLDSLIYLSLFILKLPLLLNLNIGPLSKIQLKTTTITCSSCI